MIGKRFSIFALLVIVSLLIASCGAEATPTSAPAPPTETTAPVAAPTDTTAPAAAPTDTTAPAAAATDTTAPAAAATNTTAPAAGGMTKDNPPPVANAAAAKAFASQSIKYYGDTVGLGAELDQALAKRFTADTGIAVQVIPKPDSAT
jgi:hypothetical protein